VTLLGWTARDSRDFKSSRSELCAPAAIEQEPQKLLVLVTEINRLSEEKEQRLIAARGKVVLHDGINDGLRE
jgi:hypothetical protein